MNTIAELGFAQSFFAGFKPPTFEFPFGKEDHRGHVSVTDFDADHRLPG